MKKFHRTTLGSTVLLCIMLYANYSTTGSVGDVNQIFALIQLPPGYLFGIAWGTIYTGLIIAVLSRWSLRVGRNNTRKETHYIFWISCILNTAWVIFTIMGVHAVAITILIVLWYILLIMVKHLLKEVNSLHLQYITLVPFSLYLGRLTVASFTLGTGQLMTLIRGLGVANTLPAVIVSLLLGIGATLRTVSKTTPRTGILPFIGFSVVGYTLLQDNYLIMGLISLLGAGLIGIYCYKRRLDLFIK